MTAPNCPVHHTPMTATPSEPRARCPHCGYITRRVAFQKCRECGQTMRIEEPEPQWHCASCAPRKEEATA